MPIIIVATCVHLSILCSACALIDLDLQTTPFHTNSVYSELLLYITCKHHLAALAPNMLCMLLVDKGCELARGLVKVYLMIFTM